MNSLASSLSFSATLGRIFNAVNSRYDKRSTRDSLRPETIENAMVVLFFLLAVVNTQKKCFAESKKGGLRTPGEGFQMKRVGSFFLAQHALRIQKICLADAPARKGDCLFDISNENGLGPNGLPPHARLQSLVCCCATTMLVVVVDDDESNQNLSLPLLLTS